MYGALRVHLPAKLLALFKIRNYTCENAGRRVAAVRMLTAVNSGFPSHIHSLVTEQIREGFREFPMVQVGTIHGLMYLIPEREQCWLVNRRIDLRTFNDVYSLIGIQAARWGWLCMRILILTQFCPNHKRPLANCGEVFPPVSPEFTRWCFDHPQVVYV